MKTLFNLGISCAVIAIGYMGGIWLWSEVLEDKAEDAKEYLENKFKKEGA